ncbi:MAG: cytochrome C oxidase subunit IV family protein [Phycisphaerales bacterium]
MTTHAHSAQNFDETDPHGGTPHTHVIVPPITLRLILGALLAFTVLTVATAQLESWIMSYFAISLPAWLNVAGAMLIATVKAVLVMAYFMQLRYDNPMNTIIMLFCFFAVGLFLLFTSLDLFTRDRVYDYKGTYAIQGGTWGTDKPLTQVRKEEFIKKLGTEIVGEKADDAAKLAAGEKRYNELGATLLHGHGHHGEHEATASTASHSRALKGMTGALEATAGGSEHGHDAHAGESHGEAKPAGAH